LADSLRHSPRSVIHVRHTVGLVDALRSADVAAERRVNDGLPESLEEDIERYGLDHFKVKVRGDVEQDTQRLLTIADLLRQRVRGTPRVTLDGNEQFASLCDLTELLDGLARHRAGRDLLDWLMYIEQPLARGHTFDAKRNEGMDRLSRIAPVIIDEADGHIDAFKNAVALGYRGVSVKNCKGVFRALLNFGLCRRSGGELFQSSEDLTNLPVLALQQDLATAAALGLSHSERNGHHYFAGLSHLPEQEVAAALRDHPGLYHQHDGEVRLRIEDGVLQVASLNGPGYGHTGEIQLDRRAPADAWTAPSEFA
jgi:hypothetical protein